jgi:hypothetical protein
LVHIVTKRKGDEIEFESWQRNESAVALFRGTVDRGGHVDAVVVKIIKGEWPPNSIGNKGAFGTGRILGETWDGNTRGGGKRIEFKLKLTK